MYATTPTSTTFRQEPIHLGLFTQMSYSSEGSTIVFLEVTHTKLDPNNYPWELIKSRTDVRPGFIVLKGYPWEVSWHLPHIDLVTNRQPLWLDPALDPLDISPRRLVYIEECFNDFLALLK